MKTTSPRPNGFPSPPQVSFPKRDERFALRGPPQAAEGETAGPVVVNHDAVCVSDDHAEEGGEIFVMKCGMETTSPHPSPPQAAERETASSMAGLTVDPVAVDAMYSRLAGTASPTKKRERLR